MLAINIKDPLIINARAIHIRAISCMIRRKLGKDVCLDNCDVCNHTEKVSDDLPDKISKYLLANGFLTKILGDDPITLFIEHDKILEQLFDDFKVDEYARFLTITKAHIEKKESWAISLKAKYSSTNKLLAKIFDYGSWFQNSGNQARYDAYQLAANLDRNTCTYCNRLYTSTLKNRASKKVMRPDFDHWFTKTRYPLLAMSFYNLVPSCGVCNSSIKLDKTFLTTTHIHPYINMDTSERYSFTYHFSDDTNNFTFHINLVDPHDSLIPNTIKDFKLEDAYGAHQAEMNDLLRIREAYSEKYINNILMNYPAVGLTHKEIYRLAFGAEFEKENFHKLPMSKFKHDVLKELKMLDFRDDW